jgi:dihydrodipicolinate synthase/N-acetylneuraminate lyase
VGENTALEYQEKLVVLRELLQAVSGRIPVLTGVASLIEERLGGLATRIEPGLNGNGKQAGSNLGLSGK